MIKRVLFLLICIMSFGICSAELNDEQKALREDILQFLKTEGYAPYIDEDGDITVKIEGAPYYIKVAEVDKSPMYVQIWRVLAYPEGVTQMICRLACSELNLYKMVKVTAYEKSATVACAMYLREPEAFKYAFHKMVNQIQSAVADFSSECEKSAEELNQARRNVRTI